MTVLPWNRLFLRWKRINKVFWATHLRLGCPGAERDGPSVHSGRTISERFLLPSTIGRFLANTFLERFSNSLSYRYGRSYIFEILPVLEFFLFSHTLEMLSRASRELG